MGYAFTRSPDAADLSIDALHSGRLAGAVGSDDSENLAFVYGKGDIVDGNQMSVPLDEVFNRNRRRQFRVRAFHESERASRLKALRIHCVSVPQQSLGDRAQTLGMELQIGVEVELESQRPKANAERIATFQSGPLEVLDFTAEDAEHSRRVRAARERLGKPIGAYDLLIAGQALRHKATLLTANSSEFARVRGLQLQDWTTAAR